MLASQPSASSDVTFNRLQQPLCDKLDQHEERLMDRFGSLSAEISNLRSEVVSAHKKITSLEEHIAVANSDINDLRLRLASFENTAVASDLVVRGVPNNANAEEVVKKICGVINAQEVEVKKVFRVRGRSNDDNNRQCRPIIVKLHSSLQRIRLFTLLAAFRKASKRTICRSDGGLGGHETIMLHESLSLPNRNLLNQALKLKSEQRLIAAFTLRGNVFVRLKSGDDAVLVRDTNQLMQLLEN